MILFSFISTQVGVLNETMFPENLYMLSFFGVTAFHVVHARRCKQQSRLLTTWQKHAHLGTHGLSNLPFAKRVMVMY